MITHTHPFNGPLSETTRVSRYQKGKTNLDFTEPRDSEWQWHQLGYMQVCTSLQTDNHASTPLLSFCRPDALPATQGNNLMINRKIFCKSGSYSTVLLLALLPWFLPYWPTACPTAVLTGLLPYTFHGAGIEDDGKSWYRSCGDCSRRRRHLPDPRP